MGEVYRARDTTLGRDVAIKVLPPALSADPDRLARLAREARILARLNHAAIATVHGFHEDAGVHFLVMELAPGSSLEEHIAATAALDVDEALRIAAQIAAALEAAHAAGIVHRDLKPANVMVTPEGGVKVLDFGLAKGLADGEESASDLSASPTMAAATHAGVILGTAAYMSPEQARGQAVDGRTDIWAFGCVLYEMLTGRKAFAGDTVSDILAAILRGEPQLTDLRPATPAPIRRLLRRCLVKDPRDRLQHIGDARIEIQETIDGVAEAAPASIAAGDAAPTAKRMAVAAALVVGLVLGTLGARTLWPAVPAEIAPAPSRLSMLADLTRQTPRSFAMASDGQTIAYVGESGQISVRELSRFEPRVLEGITGAESPFFSPDGQWIGYWAAGAIHRVPTAGGAAQRVTATNRILGGSWTEDGRIVFSEFVSALRVVPAQGGEPRDLTVRRPSSNDVTHSNPRMLPGDRGVLFDSDSRVAVASLPDGEWEFLIEDAQFPAYSPSGHLLFRRRDATLWAVPFDLDTLQLTGEPFPAQTGPISNFAIGSDGTFAFHHLSAGGDNRLVWVDREGRTELLPFEPGPYQSPRLSPDDNQIAVTMRNAVWILDVRRGTQTLFAGEGMDNRWPVWTHGGDRVAFTSTMNPANPLNLLWRAPGSAGEPAPLLQEGGVAIPISWSESTAELAYYDMDGPAGDIRVLAEDGSSVELIATAADERSPMFSPDGRLLAFISNESGRDEIYIAPYPAMEPRILVSNAGGIAPTWARDGRELFYRDDEGIKSVALRAGSPPQFDAPKLLFANGGFLFSEVGRGNANYATASDGRFLMVQATDTAASRTISVVVGWADELVQAQRARAATDQ